MKARKKHCVKNNCFIIDIEIISILAVLLSVEQKEYILFIDNKYLKRQMCSDNKPVSGLFIYNSIQYLFFLFFLLPLFVFFSFEKITTFKLKMKKNIALIILTWAKKTNQTNNGAEMQKQSACVSCSSPDVQSHGTLTVLPL